MIKSTLSYLNDFTHLFFPHCCAGCGNDVLENDAMICSRCMEQLPETGFIPVPANTVEKIFYGRMQVHNAASLFYFNKNSLLQQLLIELKYNGNKEIGTFLGKLLGEKLASAKRYADVDAIVPLPLNEKKERKRNYNQAALIAKGITDKFKVSVIENAVSRTMFTNTQTHKDRITRWQNMEGVFTITDEALLINKHILLVDDVITTGATLEACGSEILKVSGTKLSIATVAYTI